MWDRRMPMASLLIAWMLLALAFTPGLAPAGAAPSTNPYCGRSFPTATQGHLALDRAVVRPGESVLGVVTNFRQWPVRLMGGGSGETFLSCTPWQVRDEVMSHDAAGLYVITVPVGTKPGTYQVALKFYEGGTSTFQGGHVVQLTAPLTVSAEPPAVTGVSPACGLNHKAAVTGALAAPSTVQSGSEFRVSVTGVAHTYVLNEYDQLFFVACLAGRATAITFPPGTEIRLAAPSLRFSVPVPAGLPAGTYDLAVTGVLQNVGIVWWHRSVVVREPVLSATGVDASLATTVGTVLVAAGALVLMMLATMRRRPTPCNALLPLVGGTRPGRDL